MPLRETHTYARRALILSIVCAASLCSVAQAANRFVSNDGTWKMKDEQGQEMEGTCYTNLQECIDAANRTGDTIYVKDGFVVDGTPAVATGFNACRLLTSKTLDIIAEGGDWKTGPTVKGKHAETDSGYGTGAIRCLYQNTYAGTAGVLKFVGFNFVDGATPGTGTGNQDSGIGGCLRGYSSEKLILEKCRISEGVAGYYGGGVKGASLSDCVVTNCAANMSGGGAYLSTLYDCTVVSNRTIQTTSNAYGGGGIFSCSATRTLICGNVVLVSAGGGGAKDSTLTSCVVTNNSSGRYGGGVMGGTTMNCVIVDNRQGPNGSVGAGGGGINGGTHYNALILRNTADNQGGAAYDGTYYNCTAYANTNTHYKSKDNVGGFQACKVVNCISYGNDGGGDIVTLASNSCVQVATLAANHVDCVNIDPKFVNPAAGDYHPKAKACRNSGLVFDWMRDPADVRSKDLAGLDRILGDKPDMGCYETKPQGLTLLVR